MAKILPRSEIKVENNWLTIGYGAPTECVSWKRPGADGANGFQEIDIKVFKDVRHSTGHKVCVRVEEVSYGNRHVARAASIEMPFEDLARFVDSARAGKIIEPKAPVMLRKKEQQVQEFAVGLIDENGDIIDWLIHDEKKDAEKEFEETKSSLSKQDKVEVIESQSTRQVACLRAVCIEHWTYNRDGEKRQRILKAYGNQDALRAGAWID